MLPINLDSVSEADIQALVSGKASETTTLEFKAQPHGTEEDAKAELAKDVAAMANADGGDMVFGLAEVKYVAAKVIGISGEEFDPLVRRLSQTLDAKIDPRIPGIRFHKVSLAAGQYVVVVRVPPSFDGPHAVRYTQELRRFVFRNGASVSDMTYQQLRSAFDRTATLAQRARQFLDERQEAIWEHRAPKRLENAPLCAVHLVPISGLAGRQSADLRALHARSFTSFLPPGQGGSRTFNFDGLAIHAGGGAKDEHTSYVQIFRTGACEGVFVAGGSDADRGGKMRHAVWASHLVRECRRTLQLFATSMKQWGFSGPAVVSCALLNVEGYELHIGDIFHPFARGASDRHRLVLPECWVDSIDALAVDDVLRPMMDVLWQAFDAERCLDYDGATGEYRPPRG